MPFFPGLDLRFADGGDPVADDAPERGDPLVFFAALGGRLRLGAANRGDAALAARDALRRLMQIADRALAADRTVIEMRRLDAEAVGELLLRIAVAPAQEIDDIERADIAEQFCTGVRLRALQGFLEQGERFEASGDFLGAIDDFADADDDGDAVFGDGSV